MAFADTPPEPFAVQAPPASAGEHLYQLAYCSLAKENVSPAALHALLEQARVRNTRHNITGMLMYDGGMFIQWIEGPMPAVQALWEKLLADPRHYGVVELMRRESWTTRLFADWAMHEATRTEMTAIVHAARDASHSLESPGPWAGALDMLCLLLEGQFERSWGAPVVGA
jgi:Sensors of blue-light using FAD